MLFHMILLHILIKVAVTKGNAGTAIFHRRSAYSDCWSDDDIVKLRARKAFEELIPHVNIEEVDATYIKNVVRYFKKALQSSGYDDDSRTSIAFKEAVADAIGAHLRSEMLPTVRFAYYAGYVPYSNARQIHDLYDSIKAYLNTQGIGWRKPRRTSQKWSNLTVAKILIGAGTFFDPCSSLITQRDSNSCIHFPRPKHDDETDPASLALPFKSGGLVSLVAPGSNNVLLKYYTTASRCILSSSPKKCRHSDFVSFNNELWHWMKRDVAPHLIDEKLYTAYGGILRVAAAVQNYGKGLSRRNLFEYHAASLGTWNPWKTLTQSYIYVNTDWTPTLYVVVVLLTAFTMYLVLICYNYICGDSRGCHCKGSHRSGSFLLKKNAANANADAVVSTAPTPQQSEMHYSDRKRKNTTSRSKSASMGSMPTQRVYDLNDNTEKVMAVIMSDNESIVAKTSSQTSESGDGSVIDVRRQDHSPPKLETSMSELTVQRRPRAGSRPPLYSTSTVTHTLTGSGRARDSDWSDSTSCSSTGSSSTSRSTKSRSSRDLAWARRVVSRHSLKSAAKSSSRTELDGNSYTTPTTSNR